MIVNEDYFNKLELNDDDINDDINDDDSNSLTGSYEYYIAIFLKDGNLRHNYRYFINHYRNIIDYCPCVSDISEPRFFTIDFEHEYENPDNMLDNVPYMLVYGINANFTYKSFKSMLNMLIKYSAHKTEIYFSTELNFVNKWTYIIIDENNEEYQTARILRIMDMFNIEYDFDDVISTFWTSYETIFRNYVNAKNYHSYKNKFIYVGDVKPSQLTDDIILTFHLVRAKKVPDVPRVPDILFMSNNIDNSELARHINDDSNGNIAKIYIVVSTRGKTNAYITFYVYFTKACELNVKNLSKHYLVTLSTGVSQRMFMNRLEDCFQAYEKLGFDAVDLINQVNEIIPTISGYYETTELKRKLVEIKLKFI